MNRQFRISAGAIVIKESAILLVRYKNIRGNSFLVGPGGGTENDEPVTQTVEREVREETGLEVMPQKILFVEDLLSRRYRIFKIWFLCNLIGGHLGHTQGALEEGINEAGWYNREQLRNEIVYPEILLTQDWSAFFKDSWETKYLGLSITNKIWDK